MKRETRTLLAKREGRAEAPLVGPGPVLGRYFLGAALAVAGSPLMPLFLR